jgi:hypothetical protein
LLIDGEVNFAGMFISPATVEKKRGKFFLVLCFLLLFDLVLVFDFVQESFGLGEWVSLGFITCNSC